MFLKTLQHALTASGGYFVSERCILFLFCRIIMSGRGRKVQSQGKNIVLVLMNISRYVAL